MSLTQINESTTEQAYQQFENCCVAPRWVAAMVSARPFDTAEQLFLIAEEIWQGLSEDDFIAAFKGHPQIGDMQSLNKKYAATASKASKEQAGMQQANQALLEKMLRLNQDYKEKFGFIFIVCATGKSAEQMLLLIEKRLNNSRATELAIAANEQAKITQLRLEKLL